MSDAIAVDVSHYRFQELTPSGNAVGNELSLNWREVRVRVAFAAPRYSLADLNHMRNLLHAAPGNPVDLVLWNKEKTCVEWSARLSLFDTKAPLTTL